MTEYTDWPDLLRRLDADLRCKEQSPSVHAEDKDAWETVERVIRQQSRALLGPRWSLADTDVEDALQQVLLKLQSAQTLRRLRSAGNAEGYLMMMLKNAALDIARRRQIESRIFHPLDDNLPHHAVNTDADEDISALVEQELRSLTLEERRLLRMRFWRNMSIREIAMETGASYAAVAVRLFRILHRMRAHMGPGTPH